MLVLYRLKDSSGEGAGGGGGGRWKKREGAFLFFNFFRDPNCGILTAILTAEIASLKKNLHGLPMWFLWLCRIINCLQVTFLLLQACLFWYDRRSQKLFSAESDFLFQTPVCHQFLFKILYRWVLPRRQYSLSLLFCFCFKSKLTSDNSLCTHAIWCLSCLGYPRAWRRRLKFACTLQMFVVLKSLF